MPGLDVDALTANPLLGRDALEPLVSSAREAGAGVFVLVRTSNPGAADLMDLKLATGEPLWERLATLVAGLGVPGAAGLSDVGAVTGATAPQHLARMRELMPHTPFLLPGVGAQGGDVADLAPAFAPGPRSGPGHRLALDRPRPRADRARIPRRRPAPRPSACAAWPGRSPEKPPRAAATIALDGRTQPRALPGAARARGRRGRPLHGRELHAVGLRRRGAGATVADGVPTPTADRLTAEDRERRGPRRYRVKEGDTPSSIAEKTGVPLEDILRLNPDLDPQTLEPGPADPAPAVTPRPRRRSWPPSH